MDVDEAEVEVEVTPAPEEQVHRALVAQFTPFPFTYDARNTIFARRTRMSDELVFDLLLEQASIASPQSLYPPDSPDSLFELLEAIANCPWDTLKKSCLQYYLLSHVSTKVATKHATNCALPPQFVHLARACFLLDSGVPDDLTRAVTLLSDARIVQDLSSKVLHVLSLAPQPASSRLVCTYVRTAQPVLEVYEDLAIYLRALMEYSLADAWTFQRSFSETTPTRNQLIRSILDGCLIPPKPAALPHLLSLPLTSFEFSLLQSYVLSPPEELSPTAHAILQDLLTVRLLHSGKYSDAVRLSRAFDTLNAKSRSGAAEPLQKAAEERQQMMRDVLAVVPDVQRRQLELELNDETGEAPESTMSGSWASVGKDVTMSWENLGASVRGREHVSGMRSGRLEGSPAPVLPGRSSVVGSFTPTSSAQRRKTSVNLSGNVFGVPHSAATPSRAPVFPAIPMSGLTTSTGTPPMHSAFSLAPRFGLATPSSRLTVNSPASAPRPGAGLNARNAFYEPQPSRTGTSLFGAQPQGEGSGAFAAQRKPNGVEEPTGFMRDQGSGRPVFGEATLTDDRETRQIEDVVMVDSDDPDAFVVRGRRRSSRNPPQNAELDAGLEAGSSAMNGTTSLFGRAKDNRRRKELRRRTSSPKLLPGAYTSAEPDEEAPTFPPPASKPVEDNEPASRIASRPNRTHTPAEPEQPGSSRLKIPGGLFSDEDAEAEEQDQVPSLRSAPSRGSRRKRVSRASSVATESGDEDNQTKAPLRRSSRLSSGPSPEPPSPQSPEKKPSKRPTKAAATTRKRKTVDG